MYVSTTPSTKFTSPPKQDTEVHYDVAAAYKSDGKTVCHMHVRLQIEVKFISFPFSQYVIANVKPPKDDKERPADKNAVAYGTIDLRATAKARPKRSEHNYL